MARFCSNCGSAIDDNAGFCSKCGQGVSTGVTGGGAAVAAAPATSSAGGLADNVAGMLAYVTIIPAIVFLVMEPYNRNRFVRFHSFQCLFLALALFVVNLALSFLPIIGWAISSLIGLAALALWVVLVIKAYNGQMWKLPVIGDMAEKQANAM